MTIGETGTNEEPPLFDEFTIAERLRPLPDQSTVRGV